MFTYYTKEEKGEDVLLFLHGWGCDGSFFQPIADRIAYTSYLVDLWGFGKSDKPADTGFCVEQYAEQLHTFCIQNKLERFAIVCHSFGCRVALAFVARYPQFCQRLIVTGGAGLRRKSLKRWFKVRHYKLAKFLVKCKILKPKVLEKFGSEDLKSIQSEAMRNTFAKVVNADLSHCARAVKCPTLLVWGKADRQTPMWIAKRLNKLIADSFLITIEGGHFAFLEHATQFAAIVEAYLKN